jgi:hypothetical protein
MVLKSLFFVLAPFDVKGKSESTIHFMYEVRHVAPTILVSYLVVFIKTSVLQYVGLSILYAHEDNNKALRATSLKQIRRKEHTTKP